MVARRRFIISAGAAMLAAPTLSTLKTFNLPFLNSFDFFDATARSGTGEVYPVDRTLDEMMRESRGGNPFVAQANTRTIPVGSMRVLAAPAALLDILDNLRIERDFSDRIGYCNAAHCRTQFAQDEAVLRRRRFNAFTDIERSPIDKDVAYLVGGNIESASTLQDAAGATQFQGNNSVMLTGNEPGIVRAAAALFHEDYNPTSQEVARSFAVTSKEAWPERDGTRVGTRFETPVLSFIHDWRTQANAPLGTLIVRNKQRAERIAYCANLRA